MKLHWINIDEAFENQLEKISELFFIINYVFVDGASEAWNQLFVLFLQTMFALLAPRNPQHAFRNLKKSRLSQNELNCWMFHCAKMNFAYIWQKNIA